MTHPMKAIEQFQQREKAKTALAQLLDPNAGALSDAQRKLLKKRKLDPKGYAALPGSGPQGETCKTCQHYTHRRFASTYRKCGLMRAHWTGGAGSDVKASSPACSRWEKPKE